VGWRDRTIGIVLGVALGAGVVVAFVFLLSDRTVDAPSLSGAQTTTSPRNPGASHRARPGAPPAATVRVIGGAPPTSGPAELHYRQGARVRLRVISDSTVPLMVTGYGVSATTEPGESTTIAFRASRKGTFALIVAGSHIDVARITVGGPSP
jgi:hypothetical protein